MSDMIHRPNHYTWRGGMECIDIAKELCQGSDGVRASTATQRKTACRIWTKPSNA